MKEKDIMILGLLAIGGYFLYKYFSGGKTLADYGFGSSGGGSSGGGGGGENVTTSPQTTQAGQPSATFALNTLTQASRGSATAAQRNAAAAILAGAPPRVVAKIKAGRIF